MSLTTAKELPDDYDIDQIHTQGAYKIHTTIDGVEASYLLKVEWTNWDMISIPVQTAYPITGDDNFEPIKRYMCSRNYGINWYWTPWSRCLSKQEYDDKLNNEILPSISKRLIVKHLKQSSLSSKTYIITGSINFQSFFAFGQAGLFGVFNLAGTIGEKFSGTNLTITFISDNVCNITVPQYKNIFLCSMEDFTVDEI